MIKNEDCTVGIENEKIWNYTERIESYIKISNNVVVITD